MKYLVWCRPEEFLFQQPQLFGEISPSDVQQGKLGNCYLMSSFSALATDPRNIQKIFLKYDLEIGIYLLRLYKNGKPIFLILDDYIPCKKFILYPIFAKPIQNKLWVLLLEKAWAKLIGNYLFTTGGEPGVCMEDFSGAPV